MSGMTKEIRSFLHSLTKSTYIHLTNYLYKITFDSNHIDI